MIGLGLDLSLRNYATGISYVKANRVLDLTTPFSELTFTLEDKSGEGNDATLYSGRYISTDGSTDRGIVADCSAAGAGSYYLTGKVRPNAVTTAELTMDGSTDSGLTGLTADVWQTFTTATSAVTPSAVQVGYDGSTASAADWSDVKLIDSSDGSTVARWQLNESADGDLNGYPALDSVGGYHGTHTGCAGGTGEGIDPDVVGAAFAANEDKMYFDGVDDYVDCGNDSSLNLTDNFTIEANVFTDGSEIVDIVNKSDGEGDSFNAYRLLIYTGGFLRLVIRDAADTTTQIYDSTAIVNDGAFHSIKVEGTASNIIFTVDGVIETSLTRTHSGINTTTQNLFIGARKGPANYFVGLISDVSIYDNGVLVSRWSGYGNTNAAWLDTIGSNNGTVNGSPATVGQKRATILQTAGMDWNKLPYFSGDGTESVTFTPITFSGDIDITLDTYIVSLSGSSGAIDGGHFLSDTSGSARFYYDDSGGKFSVADDSNASASWNNPSDISITAGVFYNVRLQRTSGTWNLTVNGADQGAPNTGTANGNVTFNSWAAKRGTATSITALNGVIYNIDLGTAAWGGVSPFADTIGSNDGTVNGSPSSILIPESDSTTGEDALGNSIAKPRPTSDTWNLFGDGEYGRVADADSLDLTTEATWELWGNFYGAVSSNKTLIAKTDITNGTRSWQFLKDTTDQNDELSLILGSPFGLFGIAYRLKGLLDATAHIAIIYDGSGATALDKFKIYVNGSPATVVVNTGTAVTSLFVSTSDVSIGARPNAGVFGNYQDKKISRPKIYNRALTADEVLKNYNAQKSSFGL